MRCMRLSSGSVRWFRFSVVFAILEGGKVFVFAGVAEALHKFGKYWRDIDAGVVVFYDDDGVWLKPEIQSGPRRWLGLMPGVHGVTLTRSAQLDFTDPLELALFEAASLESNEYFGSLEDLRRKFPYLPRARV